MSQYMQFKKDLIKRRGSYCEHCFEAADLDIHHLDYSHEPGTESDNSVMLLCRKCHDLMHDNTIVE